jgi:hypothetical protein
MNLEMLNSLMTTKTIPFIVFQNKVALKWIFLLLVILRRVVPVKDFLNNTCKRDCKHLENMYLEKKFIKYWRLIRIQVDLILYKEL